MRKIIELVQRPRLSLRWKVLGGFLLAALLLLVALSLALGSLFESAGSLKTLKAAEKQERQMAQIQLAQEQLVNSALDFIWSGRYARVDEYEIARQNMDRLVKSFEPDALLKENFKRLQAQIIQLDETLNKMISLSNAKKDQDVILLWQSEGSKQADQIRSITRELGKQQAHNNAFENVIAIESAYDTTLIISVLALVALVVAVALSLLLTAALTRPISMLEKSLAGMARGDLTHQVEIVNQDELGRLGSTFNLTMVSLRDLVSKLYLQSQQVGSATAELTALAGNQVTGSSQQASAIIEATTTLQELNKTAEEISRQVLNTIQAVDQSLEQTQWVSQLTDEMAEAQTEGLATVSRTITALQNLKGQMVAIEEQQQTLASQSSTIEGIVGLIDNIARETHLLSLNASIEAAGAGALGNRFAIIAHEVKKLAEHSVQATKQAREVLSGVVRVVGNANRLAEQGLHEAEQAVDEAAQSDAVLRKLATMSNKVKEAAREIVLVVKETSEMASSIGAATQQQQQANSQMMARMLEIEAVTSQNLSSIKQGATATRQLNLTAQELEHSADAFILEAA